MLISGLLLLSMGEPPLRPVVGQTQRNTELKPAAIDAARAFGYLKAICDIGPRTEGSAANERQRLMVAEHFRKNGLEIKEQAFDATDPSNRQRKRLTNLIGSWQPEKKRRVVLGAHYDTRPYPDQDPDPAKRRSRFIGANDGASGVALLMEIANHLPKMTTDWGVDLVLFDGEELVYQDGDPYFLGSRHFARQYLAQARSRDWKYDAGLVLDMVADKDLLIEQEQYSIEYAPNVVRDLWSVAAQLGEKRFSRSVGPAVLDDHIPLNQAKIPTADVIDFEYPHWHTADDTPDKCSGESMA
ncbi:MAG: M28 family peptidase, partial [Isosphaeraceae bacterium]